VEDTEENQNGTSTMLCLAAENLPKHKLFIALARSKKHMEDYHASATWQRRRRQSRFPLTGIGRILRKLRRLSHLKVWVGS
jgi:trehalose-6-phosphatase